MHTLDVDCIAERRFKLAESGKLLELATDHMVTDPMGEQTGDSHAGANETTPQSHVPVLLTVTRSPLSFLPSTLPTKMAGMAVRALDQVLQRLLPSLLCHRHSPPDTLMDSVSLRVLKPAGFTC